MFLVSYLLNEFSVPLSRFFTLLLKIMKLESYQTPFQAVRVICPWFWEKIIDLNARIQRVRFIFSGQLLKPKNGLVGTIKELQFSLLFSQFIFYPHLIQAKFSIDLKTILNFRLAFMALTHSFITWWAYFLVKNQADFIRKFFTSNILYFRLSYQVSYGKE